MERDRLKFSIERFDHYYNSVNSKCAVFLALSTFIVGALITAYPVILDKLVNSVWIHLSIASLIALGLTIMLIVIGAATPFSSQGGDSIHYFGSIGKLDSKKFHLKSVGLNADEELVDLRNQVHELSKGLQDKFKSLRLAGILFIVQFFLLIPFLILIVTHVK